MPFNCVSILRLSIAFLLVSSRLYAQQATLSGAVSDENGNPIENVNISLLQTEKGTSTQSTGEFVLTVPSGQHLKIEFSHLSFVKDTISVFLNPGEKRELNVVMTLSDVYLQQVEVEGNVLRDDRTQVSSYKIDPVNSKSLVSPFRDFTSILATLPGVVSNSELSSSYSVRGGNFDENLVFVNNIPVYRPLLVRTGQQEGLSFVNPDLVGSIDFYAGGWNATYGDKLSSVLDIRYKKPEKMRTSLELSLLGGSAHFENRLNEVWSFAVGVRNKSSQYLLNSLEVQGEYLPSFNDVQAVVNAELNESTEIGGLFSFAVNNYEVTPSSQTTDFGFFDLPLRLFVAFGGKEEMRYRTTQSGLYFLKKFKKIENRTILSGFYSMEREFFDVEGAYRLCELQKDISRDDFNECLINRGVGSNYRSGRNLLDVASATLENRTEIKIDHLNTLNLGMGYTIQSFDDKLSEFSFTDSSDYVHVSESIRSENELNTQQFFAYASHDADFAVNHSLSYGARFHYHNITQQFLVDPRLQYAFRPLDGKNIVYRFAAGIYHQPPLYREFRAPDGRLSKDIKAQASLHVIGGFDRELIFWGRPFKLTAEGYYKYLWDVNPYYIDNVKIRYFAENNATAYVYGFDMRISGEFVVDDQSWFSLGIMRTMEDIEDDGNGYVFRPTDQRVNMAIFFQDHIPKFPSYKMHLTFFYNTPLPFYGPGEDRSLFFRGEPYQRVDIGFSKEFYFEKSDNSLVFGVEILNLTNSANVISYSWIQDVSGSYFALPNRLSQRYFNLRARFSLN